LVEVKKVEVMGIRSRYESLRKYDINIHLLVLKRENKVSDYVIVCNNCKKRLVVDKSYPFDVAMSFLLKILENHRCSKSEMHVR
jgi:hypothetical protein